MTVIDELMFFSSDPTSLADTFGCDLTAALTDIAEWYQCAEATNCADQTTPSATYCNCTGQELASLQWGSNGVTNNPKSTWDASYIPKVMSVYDWG